MDVSGSVRRPQVKSVATTTARRLGVFPQAQPPSDSASSSSTTNDDLTEDDVFWIDDLVTADFRFHETYDAKLSSSSSPSCSSTLHHNNRNVPPPFGFTESFGILAALSDYDRRSVFNLKSSITASSRMIPKPAQERLIYRSSSASTNYNQSAPVKVPMMPKGMLGTRRREFDDEDGRDDMMLLPPHEIVARTTMQRSHSQIAAYSVLEGAGRTLKGRDLRRFEMLFGVQQGFSTDHVSFCNYHFGSRLPRDEFRQAEGSPVAVGHYQRRKQQLEAAPQNQKTVEFTTSPIVTP